jgi:hypothetical protein
LQSVIIFYAFTRQLVQIRRALLKEICESAALEHEVMADSFDYKGSNPDQYCKRIAVSEQEKP